MTGNADIHGGGGRRGLHRRRTRAGVIGVMLLLAIGAVATTRLSTGTPGASRTSRTGAAIVTVFAQNHPRGVMVTSGGWAYCQQLRALARRTRFTLLCGRYAKDGYVAFGLRARRHLDWGDSAYLRALADATHALHRRVGGELALVGVSYSGFGVATLATHHPELEPDLLVVIDSYLDLVARRRAAGTGRIGREIDRETGGSTAALLERNVRVDGLAQLIASGTTVRVVWTIAPEEARVFKGATCNLAANAGVLQKLANVLGKPVVAWVTENAHGHDLWDHGLEILGGDLPGRRVLFRPGGLPPRGTVC